MLFCTYLGRPAHGIIPQHTFSSLNIVNRNNIDNRRDKPQRSSGFVEWLRKMAVPIAGLVLVLVIMGAILYVKYNHPEILDKLENYGYFGAFIVSIIFNATLILPAGNMLIQMTLGATVLNPVLLGMVSGGGAAIGEITGYVAGRSGRRLIARSKMYTRVEEWVRKWGVVTVFVFSISFI